MFLEVKIDGEVHKIRYPSWEEVEQLEKGEKNIETARGFLVGLGFPEEIARKLQLSNHMKLIEKLMGAKKN